MRPLLDETTPSLFASEATALNDEILTAEERAQLRELCILIVISEFLENGNNQSPIVDSQEE